MLYQYRCRYSAALNTHLQARGSLPYMVSPPSNGRPGQAFTISPCSHMATMSDSSLDFAWPSRCLGWIAFQILNCCTNAGEITLGYQLDLPTADSCQIHEAEMLSRKKRKEQANTEATQRRRHWKEPPDHPNSRSC